MNFKRLMYILFGTKLKVTCLEKELEKRSYHKERLKMAEKKGKERARGSDKATSKNKNVNKTKWCRGLKQLATRIEKQASKERRTYKEPPRPTFFMLMLKMLKMR